VTIGKKFSWFKAKYYIQRHDDGVLMFWTESIWKKHLQCHYDSDRYDI
jgi:hypothetical protein